MRRGPPARRTGERCGIFEDIDNLQEARTVAELVERLRPLLSELAYHAVSGEGAVLEAREEWRTEYGDALAQEASAEAPGPPQRHQATNRLPASLLAIMRGTHPSLAPD